MTRGPNKKGTTVYKSSCRVYKVSAKFNMCAVYSLYNNIIMHMTISALGVFVNTFRLPDDIPLVSTSRCE